MLLDARCCVFFVQDEDGIRARSPSRGLGDVSQSQPLVMGFIFFIVVTPTGIIMRLMRKDLLNLKYNQKKTYWIDKTGPKSKMKNQL